MPALLSHRFRARAPLATLLLGTLAWATIGDGAALRSPPDQNLSPLDPPELRLTLGRGRVVVAGTSASSDDEAQMQSRVRELFPKSRAELRFVPGVVTPAHWAITSADLLELLPLAQSASLLLQPDRVVFTAASVEAARLETGLAKLHEVLPAGMAVTAQVIPIEPGGDLEHLCRQMFAAVSGARIEFAPASNELRRSSFGALDRVVEFGWECPDARLRVTGHTDSVGDADHNDALSAARARAVAAYLVRRGMADARIEVAGKGAAEPLADNTTEFGRALNRRIEFSLL